ncbi:MAG: FAD binding domain-containing protein [Chromatiales bacterium]|nr:MAG: FAD binding domain-containing protein [Chromatiales bacterium]
MQLPSFEYLRPATLREGLDWLSEPGTDTAVVAGGSDLLVNMKLGLVTPKRLVSICDLPGMQDVTEDADGGLRIGAGCKLTDLLQHETVTGNYPALADAIRAVGSQHVRNMGTLGGNLCLPTRCWYTNQSEQWRESRQPCFKTDGELCHVIKSSARCHSLNSSDTAPALIALGASVTLASRDGTRELPVADLYFDDGVDYMTMRPGEILTEIHLPPPTGVSAFIKVAQRNGLDYAAGTIAGWFDGAAARLVLGSIGSHPVSLPKAADLVVAGGLGTKTIDAAADAARADLGEVSNLFSPPGYKRRLARSLVRRVLEQLADLQGGGK